MPEAECWICHELFEYDATDIRPFVWHKHLDGTFIANKNPNLVKTKKSWNPSASYKKKKTHWQDWGFE